MGGNAGSNLLGLVLVAVGLIVVGNVLDWWDVSLFFRGWWTLFIIVPCARNVRRDGFRSGSGFGLVLGILLLCSQWNIFSFGRGVRLVLPVVLIIYGLKVVLGGARFSVKEDMRIPEGYVEEESADGIFADRVNGNVRADFSQEEFMGTSVSAVFGGSDLNLKSAVIIEDVTINATAIFGGVNIFLPDDVNVRVSSTSLFGGTDNHVKRPAVPEWPTVYIKATAIFGGIDIK
ncbi:MAG: cell wall-active antibiotics response protein [Lachnospiraceae bacterium]|nr:cell wall-active antibiotics response protein [Lachnospiraceae bacterium]